MPSIPEGATLPDEEIVKMILKKYTSEEYERYASSVLAIWRPRFDAATEWAVRVKETECLSRIESHKKVSYAEGKAKGYSLASAARRETTDELQDEILRLNQLHETQQEEQEAEYAALVAALEFYRKDDEVSVECGILEDVHLRPATTALAALEVQDE